MSDELVDLYHSIDKSVASLASHVDAQNGRISKLEDTDEKIFDKLETLSPLVYKAGAIFTIVLTVIGAVMVKVLVN